MASERKQYIAIAGRKIGAGEPPYFIAEMSANHNGSLARALAIADAAKAAGADALKLQTYKARSLTLDHSGPGFFIDSGPWAGKNLYELYLSAQTPFEWHAPIFAHCKKIGLTVFSSPFDYAAIDLLQSLEAPAYKIASFEIVDLPLIKRAAATGKPLIVSTGAASAQEIAEAIETALEHGSGELVVLHCVSGYPSPAEESNLATIRAYQERYGVLVGLSDHTMGIAVPVAAVAMGACLVEKHFTLARADGGADSGFSLEPAEFAAMVASCRTAASAVGTPRVGLAPSEVDNVKYRRSIYVVADVAPGEVLTEANVRSIRPGFGLPPKLMPMILGARASRQLTRGSPLAIGDFDANG